jgi:hypothetical protein
MVYLRRRSEPVVYAIRITVHIHLYGIIVVKCLEVEFARTFKVELLTHQQDIYEVYDKFMSEWLRRS